HLRCTNDVVQVFFRPTGAVDHAVKLLQMFFVVVAVIAHEARGDTRPCTAILNPVCPACGHLLAQPLNNPHGANHVHRVRLRGTIHQERMQGFCSRIASGLQNVVQLAAGSNVVLLQYLVVPMLFRGVTDDYRAQIGVVTVEAGSATADPARALNHLLTVVAQQVAIVLHRELPRLQPPDQWHAVQAALEVKPLLHQLSQTFLSQWGVAHDLFPVTVSAMYTVLKRPLSGTIQMICSPARNWRVRRNSSSMMNSEAQPVFPRV